MYRIVPVSNFDCFVLIYLIKVLGSDEADKPHKCLDYIGPYGVRVSTEDFESSDPGSNPGRAFFGFGNVLAG